jgi:hypothetical protein
MEEALEKPDSVVRLKLRAKLTELPAELFTSFPNLGGVRPKQKPFEGIFLLPLGS